MVLYAQSTSTVIPGREETEKDDEETTVRRTLEQQQIKMRPKLGPGLKTSKNEAFHRTAAHGLDACLVLADF